MSRPGRKAVERWEEMTRLEELRSSTRPQRAIFGSTRGSEMNLTEKQAALLEDVQRAGFDVGGVVHPHADWGPERH